MRYSQPYGLPDPPAIPPSRPPDGSGWPRYVNGNPVVGLAGSIPPATSFDEDQLEIINVIINAGLVPTHADLTQLWQSLEILFARQFITTPIVKTVHGPGADFPDLHVAMTWVQNYTITQTGSVTFLVAAGQWVYTTTLEIWHPNANRIFIQGAALKGGAPSFGNITCTGYSPSARAVDATNQLVYLRSVFATELNFTGGVAGIRNFSFGITLRYLLLTGTQSIGPNPYDGRGLEIYADVWYDCMAVWGFGESGIRVWNCTLRAATSLSMTVCACGTYGIHVLGGGYIGQTNQETIIASCGQIGFRGFGSWNWFDKLTSKGNGNTGVDLYQGGFVACITWMDAHHNGSTGVYMTGQVNLYNQMTYLHENATFGMVANGGWAQVYNGSFYGNGSFDIDAQAGANITAVGATFAGAVTPPVNTVGNANAYIWH